MSDEQDAAKLEELNKALMYLNSALGHLKAAASYVKYPDAPILFDSTWDQIEALERVIKMYKDHEGGAE